MMKTRMKVGVDLQDISRMAFALPLLFLAAVVHAETPWPSEGACESLAADHGKSAQSSERVKACCERIFAQAGASARREFVNGGNRWVAASRGAMVCVDQFKESSSGAKDVFVRRNVISGSNTRLNEVSAVEFAQVGNRIQIFVSDAGKKSDQLLAFNAQFDGNVLPEREWKKAALPRTAWMVADGGEMFLLGSDARIRVLNLSYNDLSLKVEDRSRVDRELGLDGGSGDLTALGVSRRLGRVFLLGGNGTVFLLPLQGSGTLKAEENWKAEGVAHPVALTVTEDAKSREVVVAVLGADGSRFEARYPWPK